MAASSQGDPGMSGFARSRPALGQPAVSVNHIKPQPALTRLKQVPPERLILREIRKLVVRILINPFGPGTNRLFRGTSNPLKRYCHSVRSVRSRPSNEVPA
jgi:hypothetical protein